MYFLTPTTLVERVREGEWTREHALQVARRARTISLSPRLRDDLRDAETEYRMSRMKRRSDRYESNFLAALLVDVAEALVAKDTTR